MNSPIICETCTRDFTDECDDRSSFDEIGKVICMECFDKEEEEEADLSFKKQYEKHITDKENWNNIAPMKDWTLEDYKELHMYIRDGELIASTQYQGSWIENEEEECDAGCGTTLTEYTPIMCWVSKDKEEKTVCSTCYEDCGYKETDTNSDNEEEEDDRDGMCEGCSNCDGDECSNCDNIACCECEPLVVCEEEEEEEEE